MIFDLLIKKFFLIFLCFQFIISFSFCQEKRLIPVRRGNLYGFSDDSMNIIIKPKFHDAYLFRMGLARVKHKNKFGFINHTGKFQIPAIYDDAADFDWGFATVKKNDVWIMIDNKGDLYSGARPIDNGVQTEINTDNLNFYKNAKGKIGYIETICIDSVNFKTDTLIKANYDEIKFQYTDRLFLVKQNNKYGFLSYYGDTLVPIKYDSIIQIGFNFYSTRNIGYKLYENNLVGIYDQISKKTILPKYKKIISFDGLYARVLTINNSEIYVRKDGKEFIENN